MSSGSGWRRGIERCAERRRPPLNALETLRGVVKTYHTCGRGGRSEREGGRRECGHVKPERASEKAGPVGRLPNPDALAAAQAAGPGHSTCGKRRSGERRGVRREKRGVRVSCISHPEPSRHPSSDPHAQKTCAAAARHGRREAQGNGRGRGAKGRGDATAARRRSYHPHRASAGAGTHQEEVDATFLVALAAMVVVRRAEAATRRDIMGVTERRRRGEQRRGGRS